jgi:hypothetical protein
MARFFLHVVTPTLVGASIYVAFRSTDLLVFRWLDALGLYDPVIGLRSHIDASLLPEWMLYSLPDGIWVYATTCWMILIWRGSYNWTGVPWILGSVTVAIASELGQAVGLVPGTYQHLDIFFYLGGFLLALSLLGGCHEETPSFAGSTVGHANPCFRKWGHK